jgi:hypothetical protein
MRPTLPLVLLATCLALPACRQTAQLAEGAQLQTELTRRYPGTRVQVSWVNGFHYLSVQLDGPAFAALPESLVHTRAAQIAHEVVAQFPAARPPDTISVGFVTDHLPGAVPGIRAVSVAFPGTAIP